MGPTAPANRRPSESCADCCGRLRAARSLPASTSRIARSCPPQHRLHVAEVLALRRPDRAREFALLRGHVRRARRPSCADASIGRSRWPACAAASRSLTGTLAGGWKQRLALGCAVLHRPPIVFLDEPTSGVDPLSRRQFWELIQQMSGDGVTVFVTTHYMDEAEYCNRLALMFRGKLIALGTPTELKLGSMQGSLLLLECDRLATPSNACATSTASATSPSSATRCTWSCPTPPIAPAIRAALEADAIRSQPASRFAPASKTLSWRLTTDGRRSGVGAVAMNLRRLLAISRKEVFQILRDSRSLLIVLLMPLMLMTTLGYGVNLDTKHIPRVRARSGRQPGRARICSSAFSPPSISTWSPPSPTTARWPPRSTTAAASSRSSFRTTSPRASRRTAGEHPGAGRRLRQQHRRARYRLCARRARVLRRSRSSRLSAQVQRAQR